VEFDGNQRDLIMVFGWNWGNYICSKGAQTAGIRISHITLDAKTPCRVAQTDQLTAREFKKCVFGSGATA
jgi:hypothetical protein